ncbi:B12-binding domain-containing radical SAM protein [[Clostridium] polysaccharolyticum]|uniref:Radical SAM superfamily enzyme YgiQ, UPF0313 family n=1 Tax=[Clostridium] polysaccharolyticum TaxID=29364 RepID=A0A1H9ZTF2_9FIRM|nr:radical SAM protein [[Clostridium] polysaccharolyticum]SES84997.1 Radical SAM superfamily enzyme YgiQ, UPF0313 family [[Clostridium] polysaccharolyticum]
MIEKFNLILVTDEQMIVEKGNEISLSLAMGIIASYLEDRNISVTINDTSKLVTNRTFSSEELDRIALIYDKDRVIHYLKTGQDSELDQVVEMIIGDSWKEYDAYGISIGADFSMLQIHLGFLFGAYLKKQTGKPVFIGGNNISYLYIFKDFYRELLMTLVAKFRYVIKGPGEQIIWEIINSLNTDPEKLNLETKDGILRIKDDEVIANMERAPIITRPNWCNLDMNDYTYPFTKSEKENQEVYFRFPLKLMNVVKKFNLTKTKERKLIIPYIFNYNCIYKCAFCTQSDTDRSNMIVGDVNQVVDDIEFLSKKYQSNYFYFLNNYFPSSMNFIKAFRDELKKRNLTIYWSDCGRVNGLTLEKLQILYECGCRKLVFGFETGDEKILNLIDKRLNLEEAIHVLEWCKQVGIWADLEVIIGLPYERETEFMSTYSFIKKHNDLVNNFWMNEYFVVPNSLIGRYPERYGIELLKDRTTYAELMVENKNAFREGNIYNLTSNARLWGFNEINENDFRTYEEMKVQNSDKMRRLYKLLNKDFNQLYIFYKRILNLRQK